MSAPPKFIADVMLGKLARWLRILGYDAAYSNRYRDEEIVDIAATEGRVILTRDGRLLDRKAARDYVFVRSGDLDEQVRQLASDRGIHPLAPFSRCLECNRELAERERESVRDRVPAFVFATQERFKACPGCGRVYWSGTHGDRVRERIGRWFDPEEE